MPSLFHNAISRFVATPSSRCAEPIDQPRIDVAVVDDNPGIQNIVGQLVSKAGLRAGFAASVEQVVGMRLGGSSSLLLLDLSLERSDAFDVLLHLADIGFSGRIVPMSGQDETVLDHVVDFGKQLQLDMLPSLRKPFRADQLRAIVADHIKLRSRPVSVDFTAALESGRLLVWYQPRVDLRTYKVVGFQSVPRLNDPREGPLSPKRFVGQLSDSETTSLSVHVLRNTIKTWQHLAGHNPVLRPAIKIRAQDLASSEIIDVLKEIRPDDTRWPGITAHIADAKALNDSADLRTALLRTRIHRVQLCLEDVAAVAGIAAFPELKISEIALGRRFVMGCARDNERLSVLKEIISFAKRKQIRTVAEGIVTIEDMSALRSLGVHAGQGSLFSTAIPLGSLKALTDRNEPLWQDRATR